MVYRIINLTDMKRNCYKNQDGQCNNITALMGFRSFAVCASVHDVLSNFNKLFYKPVQDIAVSLSIVV